MPKQIAPMLATLSELPRDDRLYGFEFKWDGIRSIAYWDLKSLRLMTRNHIDVTRHYPEIGGLAGALGSHRAVLDGEIIALNGNNKPDFGLLQRRTGVLPSARVAVPIVYMIFDLLYFDGELLLNLPYIERRRKLERWLEPSRAWQISPVYRGEGRAILEAARSQELEGIVAKRLDGVYEAGGRSKSWLKVKITNRQEFVIGGWFPLQGSSDVLGALALGHYVEDGASRRLSYAGNVGTGFSDEDRVSLGRLLSVRTTSANPFIERINEPNTRFVRPELVAEVEFRGWTHGNKIRQGSFKGLRFEKKPLEVVKELQVETGSGRLVDAAPEEVRDS